MNKTKQFKRLWSLLLLLIAMLMPQGAWAANHYDAGYGSTATTYSAAGIKFKITALRMYNYQGNNSHFNSNPLVTITAGGHTHTFNLGSLTGESGKSIFYYNGEGNEDPYKGSGSFSKVTYQQTVDGIPVKAYFDNQKNEQRVSTNPDKTYKDNGDGSSKWCTADLTIEIGVQTAATVTINGNWRDESDGINKTESYSWPFDIPKHTCNSDIQSDTYRKSAATCTAAAVYYESCSWCGAAQSGTFTSGSALGHGSTGYNESYSWTGNAYNDASQDTKACTFTLTCKKCSTKVVNGASLTCTKTAHVDALCTATGSTTYQAIGSYTAANSAYNYSATKTNVYTVAALGHIYSPGSWSWAGDGHSATCTRTCGRTGCTTNTTGHTSSKSVTLGNGITSFQRAAPTCNAMGMTRYTATATVEGTQYSATMDVIDIAALGHSYGAGAWSWADDGHSATCTRTCGRTNCYTNTRGHTSSKSVTLGNGITSEQQVAPTCTTQGTTRYTATATVENVEYSDSKDVADIDIDPLNHNYGAGAWSWGNDGHSATCTRTCSYDANHTSSVSVTLGDGITSALQVAPTCGVKGTTRYTATATVENVEYTATKDVKNIAATGLHTFADDDETQCECTVCHHGFFRYTSVNNVVVDPYRPSELKGQKDQTITIVSNTNVDGKGVIELESPLLKIGSYVFKRCKLTGNLTIPNSVTEIGYQAFDETDLNGNITIGNNVTKIGQEAFAYNLYAQNVFIGNSVREIGQSAFSELKALKSTEMKCVPKMSEYGVFINGTTGTKTVVLSDDSYVYTGSNPKFPGVQSATYTRRGIKNQWGTIVVPFDVNGIGDDYDLYTLSSVWEFELTLTKVNGTLAAGTPALIRLHDDLDGDYSLTLTAANTAVSGQPAEGSAADGYQLVGTYETTELSADDYFISNNKFWSVGEMVYNGAIGVKTAPFRAYIHHSWAGAKAHTLSIRIADEDVTAVETLNAITEGDAEYYDMNGRRINSLQKGVNIVKYGNGKTVKVTIK